MRIAWYRWVGGGGWWPHLLLLELKRSSRAPTRLSACCTCRRAVLLDSTRAVSVRACERSVDSCDDEEEELALVVPEEEEGEVRDRAACQASQPAPASSRRRRRTKLSPKQTAGRSTAPTGQQGVG